MEVDCSVHVFHSSMVVEPFVGPWPLFHFRNLFYTDSRIPWTNDQPVARPLPTHRTTQTQNKRTHRHPCLEWDSNPRSKRWSERRQFMPQTARPLRSAECGVDNSNKRWLCYTEVLNQYCWWRSEVICPSRRSSFIGVSKGFRIEQCNRFTALPLTGWLLSVCILLALSSHVFSYECPFSKCWFCKF
jgi:hypothetical protein